MKNLPLTSASLSAMHPTSPLHMLRQLIDLLRDHLRLWLVPTVAIAALAVAYAFLHEPTWEASQALILRNEAAAGEKAPGKFSTPDDMKTLQETLLEVVKSRGVLESALREVGPPAEYAKPAAWPTDRDLVDFASLVTLAPPKGAEFGKTEVFYLTVRSNDRVRAVALNEAVCRRLQARFQELRNAKAESMIAELTKTIRLARNDLDSATSSLSATERRLGSDLPEMRSIQDVSTSDSALRRSTEELRTLLRENAASEKLNEELLTVLEKAKDDPGRFVTTPNHLLDSYPSLRRLKDGLVDAQLRTAALMGTMSAEHPRVKAAKESEIEIGRHMHDELALAHRGVEIELRMIADRRTLLNEQLANAESRLHVLASLRAEYANQVSEVKSRATLLERAEQNLSDARSAGAGAAASLINRIDVPNAGIRPIGPGRTLISLCGMVGGLLTGFGLVFMTIPTAALKPEPKEIPSPATTRPRGADGHFSIHRALRKVAF
ncbi:MAG: Wzz/FepE/Etk N-terminal domain-containing protein [Thermoguttaceae bacterium]